MFSLKKTKTSTSVSPVARGRRQLSVLTDPAVCTPSRSAEFWGSLAPARFINSHKRTYITQSRAFTYLLLSSYRVICWVQPLPGCRCGCVCVLFSQAILTLVVSTCGFRCFVTVSSTPCALVRSLVMLTHRPQHSDTSCNFWKNTLVIQHS